MTPGEFREIAKAMQEFGIAHLKMGDVELRRENHTAHGPVATLQSMAPGSSWHQQAIKNSEKELTSLPEGITTEPSDPIKHKVDQLTSLMKLSDTDLVDHLFPDHQAVAEESA